jgi:hypothetical protein
MSLRQLQRKHLIFVIVLGIATSFVIAATALFSDSLYPVSALPQQKERLLHRLPVEKGEPIVITDIKVNGKSISFDQEFEADDDWIKNLVFSVKNRSDKRILHMSFMLWFPRPPGLQGIGSVSRLFYGDPDLPIRKPTPQERLIGIAPGEAANVKFTLEQFEGLRSFLAATGYSVSIERVEFNINEVLFDDDTEWNGGAIFRRDKDNPNHWTKIGPSLISKFGHLNSVVSANGPSKNVTTGRFQKLGINEEYWSLRQRFMTQTKRLFSCIRRSTSG